MAACQVLSEFEYDVIIDGIRMKSIISEVMKQFCVVRSNMLRIYCKYSIDSIYTYKKTINRLSMCHQRPELTQITSKIN